MYTSKEAHLRQASLLQRTVNGILVKALCVKRNLGEPEMEGR